MVLPYWPIRVVTPQEISANIAPHTTGGTPSLSGFSQSIASDAGLWVIRYVGIRVKTPAQNLVMGALQAQMQGRLNPLIVEAKLATRPNYQDSQRSALLLWTQDTPTMDGSLPLVPFSDGSMWDQPLIVSYVVEDAPAYATQVLVDLQRGSTIHAGQLFSIRRRLYRVRRVTPSGDNYLLSIYPPLREDIKEHWFVNFQSPECKVKLLDDDSLGVSYNLGKFASPTVSFIEDLS